MTEPYNRQEIGETLSVLWDCLNSRYSDESSFHRHIKEFLPAMTPQTIFYDFKERFLIIEELHVVISAASGPGLLNQKVFATKLIEGSSTLQGCLDSFPLYQRTLVAGEGIEPPT